MVAGTVAAEKEPGHKAAAGILAVVQDLVLEQVQELAEKEQHWYQHLEQLVCCYSQKQVTLSWHFRNYCKKQHRLELKFHN
jgi:hypothetical protein